MEANMARQHEDAFEARIERVSHQGVAFIDWWEAYLWTGSQRLTKKIWREIRERFAEAEERRLGKGADLSDVDNLHIYTCGDLSGFYLIHPNGLKKLSELTAGE
jgi:hypothetical protein